jgi:hypothetical protein
MGNRMGNPGNKNIRIALHPYMAATGCNRIIRSVLSHRLRFPNNTDQYRMLVSTRHVAAERVVISSPPMLAV